MTIIVRPKPGRVEDTRVKLVEIHKRKWLMPQYAGKAVGRLGFAGVARANLEPFRQRQYKDRGPFNLTVTCCKPSYGGW
jgi:hypothetical protein